MSDQTQSIQECRVLSETSYDDVPKSMFSVRAGNGPDAEFQDQESKELIAEILKGLRRADVRTLVQTNKLYSTLRWMTSRSSICAFLAVAYA